MHIERGFRSGRGQRVFWGPLGLPWIQTPQGLGFARSSKMQPVGGVLPTGVLVFRRAGLVNWRLCWCPGMSWKRQTVSRTNLRIVLALLTLLPLAACSEHSSPSAGQPRAVSPGGRTDQRDDRVFGVNPGRHASETKPAANSVTLTGKVILSRADTTSKSVTIRLAHDAATGECRWRDRDERSCVKNLLRQ